MGDFSDFMRNASPEERKAHGLNAARCANFMQKMKMLLWEKTKQHKCHDMIPGEDAYNILPDEKTLDEIAMKLYDYLRKD